MFALRGSAQTRIFEKPPPQRTKLFPRGNGGNSRAIVRSDQLSPGRTCGRRRSRTKTSDWPFYFPAA